MSKFQIFFEDAGGNPLESAVIDAKSIKFALKRLLSGIVPKGTTYISIEEGFTPAKGTKRKSPKG